MSSISVFTGYRENRVAAAGWTQKVYSRLRESDPPHKHGPRSLLWNCIRPALYNRPFEIYFYERTDYFVAFYRHVHSLTSIFKKYG